MMVDPPGGWRYGFPKKMPDNVEDMVEWIISEGYPRDVMESYGKFFFVRMWEEDELD